MFLGEYEHTIDEKGRLAIPARFRPQLNDGLVVTRGFDRCLFIWPMEQWRSIAEKLARLPLMQAEARRIHRLLFSGAVDTQMDRTGRVLIPQFLRTYAELSEQVVVVGLLNRVEIWSKTNWEAERTAAEEQSAQLAEHLADLGI
ncbi:MAG TPA: division/cell wall cluster transcriptional repressor MraZ [Chloroflexota bacterium]|jgi:MraZ protein